MHLRTSFVALIAVACAIALWCVPARAEPLRAVQVFVSLSQKLDPAERGDYLRSQAGSPVRGAGHLEAVMSRTYYDTSVPDTNPTVALIQVSPGRKIVCGLPETFSKEKRGTLKEGFPVTFRGLLSDAQDWGEWSTLYLGDCSIHPR